MRRKKMKRVIIPIIITLAIAVTSCGPKRYLTTSRAPGVALDRINIGAYNNDPGADKARTAFDKADKGIAELNRLRTYDLEEDELAILMGATVTTAEVNRLSGVTSAIQTQINGRIRSVDSTGTAAGNYVTRKALRDTVDTRGARIVNDSLLNRIAAATIGLAAADTNTYGGAATRTFVESLLGSGSGLSAQRLPFIIGVTPGAPSAIDSTIIHSEFAGKHIDVYRDGAKQYQNFTATNTVEGFRVNGSTITVNPAWQANEQVLVDMIQPVMWSYLSLEGEESTLLTGLSGYWKLDETSGTTAIDATGTQNGTALGTVGVAGKIGYANSMDASGEGIRIPHNDSVIPSGTAFSVSMWVWLDSIPSTVTGLEGYYLFKQENTASPWEPHNIQIKSYDDLVFSSSTNTTATAYSVKSSGVLSDSTWHHIVFINRGDGQPLLLYIDGADVSTTAGTFAGTLFEGAGYTYFGNAYIGAPNFVRGKIDECGIWLKALSSGEIASLYNSGNGRTYPFN
jgi:hypothetical protein